MNNSKKGENILKMVIEPKFIFIKGWQKKAGLPETMTQEEFKESVKARIKIFKIW